MRQVLLLSFLCFSSLNIKAQYSIEYQKPSGDLKKIVDYQIAPSVSIDKKNDLIVFYYRNIYVDIEELKNEEIYLAGLSVNPKNWMPSSVSYINNIKYKRIKENKIIEIKGLPENAKIAHLAWSPDQSRIAFTNTNHNNVELWCFDFIQERLFKIVNTGLNSATERPYSWLADSDSFIVKFVSINESVKNTRTALVQDKPVVYSNDRFEQKQYRTYTGLLKNYEDENTFQDLVSSELYKVDLNGKAVLWKGKGMYTNLSLSPNLEYVLISKLLQPFPYTIPYKRFATSCEIYDMNGGLVLLLNEQPTIESLPKGFGAVRNGKRNIDWRSDEPATIFWIEALDSGDPNQKEEFRDAVFQVEAPFDNKPVNILNTKDRYIKTHWATDTLAIVYTVNVDNRFIKTIKFNPRNILSSEIIHESHYQDKYNDIGSFDLKLNEYNRPVLNLKEGRAYLIGEGYSVNKRQPFIDEIDLKTLVKNRVFESDFPNNHINIISITDVDKGDVLISLEAPNEYPNYYLLNTESPTQLNQITFFDNPFEIIKDIHKKILKYHRKDGVNLSGSLYLPPNYDLRKKERLPLIISAYPKDFDDKEKAGQNISDENEFIYPFYSSPIYWTSRGYAVFDEVSFPIVDEGESNGNDTYLEQLEANAEAAINLLDSLGYADRTQVVVMGHSYGAFMVANLLTHTDLFVTGIAQNGAYNRTLTPFGFQSEERTLWETPDTYYKISPFLQADKLKHPILLIHGEKDDNYSTPMSQSKSYYDALSSLGKTVKLVVLPNEKHSLRARESILHMLWETDEWLSKYLKTEVVGE